MKAINRLCELDKIKKYSSYINDELIPGVNERLKLNLKPSFTSDPYTYIYTTTRNEDDEFMSIMLKFTTNRKELEGKFFGTFIIKGLREPIGDLYGDLETDIGIIEDTYYWFYEQERQYIKYPAELNPMKKKENK